MIQAPPPPPPHLTLLNLIVFSHTVGMRDCPKYFNGPQVEISKF